MLKQTRKAIMEDHIDYLCGLYDIEKIYVSSREAAEAWINVRCVWIPTINGPVSYYIALHEIGHFVTHSKNKVEREAKAWMWALDKGKVGNTKAVRTYISRAMKRYANKFDPNDCPVYEELKGKVESE